MVGLLQTANVVIIRCTPSFLWTPESEMLTDAVCVPTHGRDDRTGLPSTILQSHSIQNSWSQHCSTQNYWCWWQVVPSLCSGCNVSLAFPHSSHYYTDPVQRLRDCSSSGAGLRIISSLARFQHHHGQDSACSLSTSLQWAVCIKLHVTSLPRPIRYTTPGDAVGPIRTPWIHRDFP